MRSKSLVKLPSAHNRKEKHTQEYDVVAHRKQIQGTLKELHKLQSQIYDLNVAQNPHSSSPVKKQIKQLSYLYENMVKPKQKNSLNIKSQDIELALRIMNKDWNQEVELDKQMLEEPNLLLKSTDQQKKNVNIAARNRDHSYKIPKDTLKYKFSQITQQELNVDFITYGNAESVMKSNEEISVKQLYNFINFTDCQAFDPVEEAYNMFLNPESGKFDMKIYNEFSQILGLPPIKHWNTFLSAIHMLDTNKIPADPSSITLEHFKLIFDYKL